MSMYWVWGNWKKVTKKIYKRVWEPRTMDGDYHPFYEKNYEYRVFNTLPINMCRQWPPETKDNDERLNKTYSGSRRLWPHEWVMVWLTD